MTEPGDPVSRRYRDLEREEPPGSLDAAILARARTSVGARPRSAARWMGPVSIAAVLVLGIGVSLRMQLEQPGIETSAPSRSQMEYSAPAAPPAPAAAPEALRESARDAVAPAKQKEDRAALSAPKPQAKRLDVPKDASGVGARSETRAVTPSEPNPFTDGPVVMQQAPSGASTPATTLGATAPLEEKTRAKVSADLARAPPPAAAEVASAPAPAQAPAAVAMAPAPPPAAAPQASAPAAARAMASARPTQATVAGAVAPQPKLEANSANTAERELRKSLADSAPDPDPARELERIAKMREAGAQGEADRALEAFRKRHPDFRIPEAMWERVKPR